MTTRHCPKCDMTFRHENAETVFCPKCKTVLCEIVPSSEKQSHEIANVSLHKKGIWPILKMVIWAIVCFQVIGFFAISLFQNKQPIEPVSLILFYPLWCGFSCPLLRLFTKEYSTGAVLSALWFG